LKTAARTSEATTVIDVVRRLFNLREQKPGKPDGEPGEHD
jgi:hypothetical protein